MSVLSRINCSKSSGLTLLFGQLITLEIDCQCVRHIATSLLSISPQPSALNSMLLSALCPMLSAFFYFCPINASNDHPYYYQIIEQRNLSLEKPRQITAGAFLMLYTDDLSA